MKLGVLTVSEWQKCPVCEGRGMVPVNFYSGLSYSTSATPVCCRTCSARGVIARPESAEAT